MNGWFEGNGKLTYPSGTVYEGAFHRGDFHGTGSLTLPGKGSVIGEWDRGVLKSYRIVFDDGLEYKDKDWDYLNPKSIAPGWFRSETVRCSRSDDQLTNSGLVHDIPLRTFDTGNGYYDATRGIVFAYDQKTVIYRPNPEQAEWIMKCCRQGR